MRGLLVIILSLLQFLAPARNPASASCHSISYAAQQTSQHQLYSASLEHQESAEISPASFWTTTHSSQVRNLPFVKYFTSVAAIGLPYLARKGLPTPEHYSYCKPIGLLLIFPQHYYW